MNRLQAQWYRLYLPRSLPHPGQGCDGFDLVDPDGRVRAMVLELAGPAGWDELSNVWQGVQVDLQMPAPAIAVSGLDGYQLWFSAAQALPTQQALAFLEGLRRRYLAGIAPERIRMTPSPEATQATTARLARQLPPAQVASERWSAFVAPDLAGMFAHEPWLDHPPGADAQADLLSRLESTAPDALLRASGALGAHTAQQEEVPAPAASSAAPDNSPVEPAPPAQELDPKRFLRDVMHDPAVELRLRIEAAKALLPYVSNGR